MAIRSEEYVYKAKEFVNLVSAELQSQQEPAHANHVIVSGFKVLRDSLSPEESLHLISQLPLYVKAAFVDGWHPEGSGLSKNNRSVPSQAEMSGLLNVLKNYVSAAELQQVIQKLPEDIKPKP